ncbi:IS4 family transposase [Methylolobus aquaticus]
MQHDTAGQPYVLARALGLYATDARLMLKATLAPYLTGERALLATLLPHLESTDLLLMDRGFPAVWLFTLLQQRGLPFLARLDGTQWPCVDAFLRSGQDDTVVTRCVGAEARKQAAAAGQTVTDNTLTFRLLKVVMPNGTVEVLATSLTDAETYPATAFADLYHARWTIEEAFKLLKHRLHLEQFTGELPESIRQDFHAKVFTANLAQALARASHAALPADQAQRYRPNLTHLLQSLKPLFAWLIQRVSPEQVLTLLELAGNTLQLRRPGRSAPRPLHRVNPRPRRQYK